MTPVRSTFCRSTTRPFRWGAKCAPNRYNDSKTLSNPNASAGATSAKPSSPPKARLHFQKNSATRPAEHKGVAHEGVASRGKALPFPTVFLRRVLLAQSRDDFGTDDD